MAFSGICVRKQPKNNTFYEYNGICVRKKWKQLNESNSLIKRMDFINSMRFCVSLILIATVGNRDQL